MKTLVGSNRSLGLVLALILVSNSMISPVFADIVPTNALLNQERLESTRDEVSSMLQREQVASMLTRMGVDVQSAQARVGSMTQSELELLTEKMQELPAGEGALGTVAMVLLILILLDVAGVTDIFPAV